VIWQWQLEPIPVAGVFYLALAYALCVGPLRWRYFPEPFPHRHVTRLGAGIALLPLVRSGPAGVWALALEDQQLAGGIMGLFVMLALTIAAGIAFFQWLRETETSRDESAAPEA
jgi:hypothetical protein